MKVFSHVFHNNGLTEYNDDVFEKAIFDLSAHNYTFKVTPSNRNKYWRFGFAFSKTRDFNFTPNSGRYDNKELKYIEIDIGEKNLGEWHLEDHVWLGNYEIEEWLNKPTMQIGYVPFSEIIMDLRSLSNEISVSYTTNNVSDKRTYLIKNYPYFKVFAWADGVEFEIACEMISETVIGTIQIPIYDQTIGHFSIKDDFEPVLEVKELAVELAGLLRVLEDEKGNMFGIFGKWGRGKTYLWRQLWNELEEQSKNDGSTLTKIEFHAWKYQDTPASWAYLYETLADKYFQTDRYKDLRLRRLTSPKSSWPILSWIGYQFQKIYAIFIDRILTIWRRFLLNATRLGVHGIVYFFLGLTFFIIWLFIPFSKKLEWGIYLGSTIGFIALIKLVYLFSVYKPKALELLKQYSAKISFQKHLGLQAEIQKEIKHLLNRWIGIEKISNHRLVLFVDDIDRCSEERIIQVVDALKVMLEDPDIAKRMLIIVALDERVLKMAIRFKYHQIISENNPELEDELIEDENAKFLNTVTKEYIDKLFIGGISLGSLSEEEREDILENITKDKIGANISENVFEEQFSSEFGEEPPVILVNNKIFPIPDFEAIATETDSSIGGEFEISVEEYKMLRKIIAKYREATPRSIRIFYYRYLLAKRLMKYKFKKGTTFHRLWNSGNVDKSILPNLILFYSTMTLDKKFEKEYQMLKEAPPLNDLKKTYYTGTFTIKPTLYKHLLKVVEMVVPY